MKNRLDWELFSIFVNNFFEEELNVWEIKKNMHGTWKYWSDIENLEYFSLETLML